jgi:hypothetical protein
MQRPLGKKSVVAITGLEKRIEKPAIVSGIGLDTFKSYRCYDDFEQQPLHGTFFIDGAGLIRWQDISYEPFQDTKFLLVETKRLLGQTAAEANVAD